MNHHGKQRKPILSFVFHNDWPAKSFNILGIEECDKREYFHHANNVVRIRTRILNCLPLANFVNKRFLLTTKADIEETVQIHAFIKTSHCTSLTTLFE